MAMYDELCSAKWVIKRPLFFDCSCKTIHAGPIEFLWKECEPGPFNPDAVVEIR